MKLSDEFYVKRLMGQLEILQAVYDQTLTMCDPVTYQARMQNLIHTMAEVMLLPLREKRLSEATKFLKKIKQVEGKAFYDDEGKINVKFPKKKKVKK